MNFSIGGVPEHFNYPIKKAISDGAFSDIGIDLHWNDIPEGTGAMCKKLRSGDLDIAIVLTEGIVKDILDGNPSKIVQKYVKSPLIWGIHTPINSTFQNPDQLVNARFAISRKGSGSHIMAHVNANNRSYEIDENQFVIVNNFDGALQAFKEDRADVILWEKYTTQPYVDRGELRRIGECITPWPCFVIAVNRKVLQKHPNKIWNILWVIRKACRIFMHNEQAPEIISEKYGLKLHDARNWYHQTEWEQDIYISQKMLLNVGNTLIRSGVIDEFGDVEDLCWNRSVFY
jgi:ABC-type nitrate/sulfonate/bicarbonate transport system substrate-binding protein